MAAPANRSWPALVTLRGSGRAARNGDTRAAGAAADIGRRPEGGPISHRDRRHRRSCGLHADSDRDAPAPQVRPPFRGTNRRCRTSALGLLVVARPHAKPLVTWANADQASHSAGVSGPDLAIRSEGSSAGLSCRPRARGVARLSPRLPIGPRQLPLGRATTSPLSPSEALTYCQQPPWALQLAGLCDFGQTCGLVNASVQRAGGLDRELLEGDDSDQWREPVWDVTG